MAAALNTTVPTRFLATVAHLMAIAMIFYSMDDNIRAGLSLNYSQSDYDAAERQYAFGAQSGRAARTPTHAPPPPRSPHTALLPASLSPLSSWSLTLSASAPA